LQADVAALERHVIQCPLGGQPIFFGQWHDWIVRTIRPPLRSQFLDAPFLLTHMLLPGSAA
jgi:hypothetical protein